MTKPSQEVERPQPDPIARVVSSLTAGLPQQLLLAQTITPGRPRPYTPRVGALSEAKALVHHKAVQEIAKERFAFPTDRYRDYKTYVNVPVRTMGVEMSNGAVAYPDIVVVQAPENFSKILAQVEMAEMVNEGVARAEWLPYAQLAPLYLYVPVGQADATLRLCRKLDIPIVGVRTWRYVLGYEQLEISDHYSA